ncbi:MAG: prephenate dehydratase [Candidatus Omnitrophica bacterium]|nr:prephenate dehydratase [Candidatus Omnitrophota bacterium]
MKGNNLEQWRKKINELDAQLLKILNERINIVRKIAEIKSHTGTPGFDPSREKVVVERLKKINEGPLSSREVEVIMETIFRVYRSYSGPFVVAYLGPPGTFTHQAALKRFGERDKYLPCKTISQVFQAVEKYHANFGVVFVLTSIEGLFTLSLGVFLVSDFVVLSELLLEIHHCLLSRSSRTSSVRKIYSHSQALGQCRQWIEENLPGVEQVETESTIQAVQRAQRSPGAGAIAPQTAANIYRMKILAFNIEDYRENITRFLVIGRNFSQPSGHDKTSILFSIKDRVGALHDMLVPFKKYNINLTRIESRPTRRKAWEYVFFVDFEGHKDQEKVKAAIEELSRQCVYLRVLGSYPAG